MEEDGAFSFAPLPHLPSVVCLHVWLFSGEKRGLFFVAPHSRCMVGVGVTRRRCFSRRVAVTSAAGI